MLVVHSLISALAQAWPRQGTENSLMYRPRDRSQTNCYRVACVTVDMESKTGAAVSGAHRILTQEPNGTKSRARWLGRRSVSLCLTTSSGSFSGLAKSRVRGWGIGGHFRV